MKLTRVSDELILERARAFRADDSDKDTQAELDTLLARAATDAKALAELRDRFATRLSFGTAGLRGLIGAGDNRMNRRVVAQTTAALCAELLVGVDNAQQRGLCIGLDGRHKSREFADEVQAVANAAGFVVHAFETPLPTPLLAYAVRACGAAAGVMITASHNPAAYNGYKVYWEDGAQLNAPHDSAVATRIESGPNARELPRVTQGEARARGLWHSLEALPARYLADLRGRLTAAGNAAPPRVAYTAMHGVGEQMARAALTLTGVTVLESVAGQAAPDPDFPTVSFPNPEEPGALDRLLQLAREMRADVALANDPDADRLAAAVFTSAGEARALSGNELGVLLVDYLLARSDDERARCIVTTIVSTPLAERIARAHGAHVAITLTGFKWIVQRALELEAQGMLFVLGFEEALGYCIGDLVRDKDGIAAAAHVAQMTQWHASRGCTLWQALEALYVRHGLWESRQVSIALRDAEEAQQLHDRLAVLRRQPPSRLGQLGVTGVRDLLFGPNPDGLAKSDVFVLELQGGQRVTFRPSGTEPKLKLYLDCNAPVARHEELAEERGKLGELLDELERELRALLLS